MITSGFFNSVGDDRLYNAEQMTTYFEGLISDGVYSNVGEALKVNAAGGMDITVGTGRALVKLHWIKNDAILPLTISAADVQHARFDAVVLKCDLNDSSRSVTIEIKQGTPSAAPAYPEMLNTQAVKEMPLAFITVRKNATTINAADIQDARGSTACGWVTGLIKQVDTSELFTQYNAAYKNMLNQMQGWQQQQQAQFESWFNSLTDSLHIDTTLRKYEFAQITGGENTDAIKLIPEYEIGDILLVQISGVLFNETDYTVMIGAHADAYGNMYDESMLHFKRPITQDGVTITQILIKAVIGQGAISSEIDEINGEVI